MPNITGSHKSSSLGGLWRGALNSINVGAIYVSRESETSFVPASSYADNDNNYNVLAFDASRANPIYGESNTVQPASIKLIPILKY